MNLINQDKKYLARDSAVDAIEVVKTEGPFIFDKSGKKYIDFITGWCVGNVGWGNSAIRQRIKNFTGPEYVNPGFLYQPWVELAELLSDITPTKLQVCFRATGGTEAVEIALQAAMAHTKRSEFISIEGAYHGHSIAALSVGASQFRKWYSNLLPHCHKLKAPLDNNAIPQLELILKDEKIAALIMEPIICNLGVVIPSNEFMKQADILCKKYGTLLIMDEVATGFGRTGKLFASEHFDIEPDILCMGKGLTGGYGALGATITTEAVAKSMEFDFSFYSTFGWHPIATEAAIANIQYILKNQKIIEKNTDEMSDYFITRLKAMDFPCSFSIRAKGLAIAIQFERADCAEKIVLSAKEKGVLLSTLGNKIITLFPALTIDHETAKQGLDIIESVSTCC